MSITSLAKDKCKLPRGNFNKLEEKHIKFFRKILDDSRVVTDSQSLNSYNEFWLKHFKGSSHVVLQPKTTEEVSKILSFCNENLLAVCPQGGNTSICGGSIAVYDEIIISLSLMNNIIELDEYSDVLVCEAGCILGDLQNFLKNKDLMMPVDLASKGSCQIGGNVATNAGGLQVLRYGSMHGSVLGLKVVKANGEIIDCLNTLKKDNSGYHLKNLFIGSEGTLGIVTEVAIKCVTLPKNYSVAVLGLDSFENILQTVKHAKNHLSEILSSCEMMDKESVKMVETNLKIKNELGDFPFYMLIEISGSNSQHNNEKMEKFIQALLQSDLVLDAISSSDPIECKSLWEVRERFAESMKHDGYIICYDLSFSLKDFYKIVPEMSQVLKDKCKRVCGMGHLGDGNLHLQVSMEEYDEKLKEEVDKIVYNRVTELKGSISAEHGIGFLKTDILHHTKSKSAIELMREVKRLLDPNGILNPYKVLKI